MDSSIYRPYRSWLLPIGLSIVLFLGYFIAGLDHEESTTQYFKGLTFVEHFRVHFVAGMFFGLLGIIAYWLIRQKRAFEPIVFFVTIALAHWPDIRFAYRKLPHDPWEIIFLLHTVVDESAWFFWMLLFADVVLALVYFKLIKPLHLNTS